MPGFLYFVPSQILTGIAPSPDELAEIGLSYAFEGRPHFASIQQGGPGAGRGSLLACRRRFEPGQYKIELANQEWKKHPSGKYWVGRFTDLPLPKPTELARDTQIDGYRIELADGQKWQIPLAFQNWDSSTPGDPCITYRNVLPHSLGLGDDGLWSESEPLPKYRRLVELAQAWNDVQRNPPETLPPELVTKWNQYQTLCAAAVEVLAINYVVGPIECAMLGILTYQHAERILDQTIDEPEFELIKKKWREKLAASTSVPAGSPSPPGHAVATNSTAPLSPT